MKTLLLLILLALPALADDQSYPHYYRNGQYGGQFFPNKRGSGSWYDQNGQYRGEFDTILFPDRRAQ